MDRADESGAERIVAVLRMGPSNAENFLIPLEASPMVADLTVVRPDARPRLMPDGVRYIDTSADTAVGRAARTAIATWRVVRRDRVDRVLSFNATPYGLIAALVCVVRRVPFHVGFVGSDALDLATKPYGFVVDRLLRRASLTTVPGEAIGTELVRRGYPAEVMEELPHTIDLDRFSPAAATTRDIDVLFVGNFIERKQVGVLVAAMELAVQTNPDLRCVLVGEGPLEPTLRAQVAAAGLEKNIEFVGYQTEPETYFARARVIAITSSWEGFPFVLVMGMCCGAVPVSTVVGSIGDFLTHDVDGVLVDDDRPRTVAAAIMGILADESRLASLRTGVLSRRQEFGFARSTGLWSDWLRRTVP